MLFLFDKRNTQGYSLLICQFRLDSNPELRLGDVTTVNWTVSEVIRTVFLFGLKVMDEGWNNNIIIILIILCKGNEN